jgi:hypothetical protein
MMFHRLIKRFVLMNAFDEGGGGGSGGEVQQAVVDPATAAVDTSSTPSEQGTPTSAAPTSMLDAITKGLEQSGDGQPRDPSGRFLAKPGEKQAVAPGTVPAAAVVVDPLAKPKPEDKHAMPEGLAPDSAKRFQTLVNENKEVSAKLDMATRQVEYVKTTFAEHSIQQPQFEQAAAVIGMINRGDFAGARQVLINQLEQIAVMTGEPVGAVDPLASFPDLRQKVDGLEMTEAAALQVARARSIETGHTRQREQQQQQQESQQQAEAAATKGLNAVDAFSREMQAADIDYPAIEKLLLPRMKSIMAGLEPHQWAGAVRNAYQLIKETAPQRAQPLPTNTNALRPTGQASPSAKPQNMRQAMFGG